MVNRKYEKRYNLILTERAPKVDMLLFFFVVGQLSLPVSICLGLIERCDIGRYVFYHFVATKTLHS